MSEKSSIPVAVVHLDVLTANYALLLQRVESGTVRAESGDAARKTSVWPGVMPVIKADAYGHGHIEVGLALMKAGATVLASGSMAEAAVLRQGLEAQGFQPRIVSLLGLCQPSDVALALEYDLIPVVHSFSQLALLTGREMPERRGKGVSIALKCNSGMSRLGFNPEEAGMLRERLRELVGVRAVLALSHLHSADTADGVSQVQSQARVFAEMMESLKPMRPEAVSLCNSAGTLLAEYVTPILGPHICRPGIALYGGNPFAGTALADRGWGFAPAMSVHTPVIAVRTLACGECIGYGHTWRAERRTQVGVIAAGYADGLSRGLSNKGVVCVAGKRAPVIGRVSMQMTAVDLTAVYAAGGTVALGEPAYILGGPHEACLGTDELAALWGTISYEVLCMLGRNRREYCS